MYDALAMEEVQGLCHLPNDARRVFFCEESLVDGSVFTNVTQTV